MVVQPKNKNYIGKEKVILYSDEAVEILTKQGLYKICGNLIVDYIEQLYLNGINLEDRDIEKEVYIFYMYFEKYKNILTEQDEDQFINKIIEEEIKKSNQNT